MGDEPPHQSAILAARGAFDKAGDIYREWPDATHGIRELFGVEAARQNQAATVESVEPIRRDAPPRPAELALHICTGQDEIDVVGLRFRSRLLITHADGTHHF